MLSLTSAARIALLVFPLLITGCGQTGPLVLAEGPDTATEIAVPPQDPNAP